MEWLERRGIAAVVCSVFLCACGAPAPRTTTEWAPQVGDPASAGALVQTAAAERWPDEFAGVWRKGDRIVVAFTANADEKAAVLEQEVLGGASPVAPRTVEHSLQDLEALQQRMAQDRDRVQAAATVPNLPGPIANLGGQFDLDIDIKRNVVVVYVEKVTPRLRDAFRTFYDSTAISFGEGLTTPN